MTWAQICATVHSPSAGGVLKLRLSDTVEGVHMSAACAASSLAFISPTPLMRSSFQSGL